MIPGVDALTNIVELMALYFEGSPTGRRLLRRFGRSPRITRAGSYRLIVAVLPLWLFINLSSQFLVALLGVFWPIDNFACSIHQYSDVAMADLSGWTDNSTTGTDPGDMAWRYGMDALSWRIFAFNKTIKDLSKLPGTPIYIRDTIYEYRLFYRHPNRPYSGYQESDRGMQSSATCEQLGVQGDVFARGTSAYLNVSLGGLEWYEVEIPT